jgi:hypothetical protein
MAAPGQGIDRQNLRAPRFLAKRSPGWKQWPENADLPMEPRSLPGFENPSHPEIEDQSLLEWGLEQSAMSKEGLPTIDVLHGYESNLGKTSLSFKWGIADTLVEWNLGVDDTELEEIVSVGCLYLERHEYQSDERLQNPPFDGSNLEEHSSQKHFSVLYVISIRIVNPLIFATSNAIVPPFQTTQYTPAVAFVLSFFLAFRVASY